MPRRTLLVPCVALLAGACVPDIESQRSTPEYDLDDFRGPEGIPGPPAGTRGGVNLSGWWLVARAERIAGSAAVDHLFEEGALLWIDRGAIQSIRGITATELLTVQPEWSVNRSDDQGALFGFGFERRVGELQFLHYGFEMSAASGQALATEAFHFAEAGTGVPVWGTWEIELRRVMFDGPESLPEDPPLLRLPWQR